MRTVPAPSLSRSRSSKFAFPAANRSQPGPGKHWAAHLPEVVMAAIAITIVVLRLRALPSDILHEMLGGFIILFLAFTGLGLFLWWVKRGVARDNELEQRRASQSGQQSRRQFSHEKPR